MFVNAQHTVSISYTLPVSDITQNLW